ncbi:MAG: aryl-sulfate sulfotransferase [Ignavibacteriae bacterium]|nr:aryl-sulfate sulfotransferase [Ignavibacteriota bacterium]
MKFFLIIVIVIVACFHLNLFSIELKPFEVTYQDNPSIGYLFMTPHLSGQFYMIDNAGEPVYYKSLEKFDALFNLNMETNGFLSFFSGNKYYIMNRDLVVVDSFSLVGDFEGDFHDFALIPNGNAVLIGRETRFVDMSKVITGGNPNALVFGNVVQELDKNKNVVFQWSSFDHFKFTDVTSEIDIKQPSFIACHMNSVFYDTDGNIIISSRILDEITKINRQTGEIMWRLGGKECKNNQFRFLNDTIDGFWGFSHQHSVVRLSNGNILMFDNGNLKPKEYSRAVEYKIDEQNKTIEKIWEYSPFPEIKSSAMGNVQRLANGNTLICWGINTRNMTATEVKPDGTKAMEIIGYQNYSIYRNFLMAHSVLRYVDKPGLYDFSNDTNKTEVKIIFNKVEGNGYVGVEEHFYKPHNLSFELSNPFQPITGEKRWVLQRNGISDFEATIRIYVDHDTAISENNYFIFCREYEGKGNFSQLDTRYNKTEKCFEADIKGSGEFIIGIVPTVLAPIALFPPNGENNIETGFTLMWQTMSVSTSYRFQLSYYPDFSNQIIDSTNMTTTWLDLNLDFNTTYYWRVKAFNNNEQSPWSKVFSFTTRTKDILSYPLPIYPQDRDTLVPLDGSFKWENVPGALYYNVEVYLDPELSLPVLKRYYISESSLDYNGLIPERPHYWRVESLNNENESGWSPSWMFVTDKFQSVDLSEQKNGIEISNEDGILTFSSYKNFTGSYQLNIYDMIGELISYSKGISDNSNKITINFNIQSHSTGLYVYKLLIGNQLLSGKFIIEN